MAELGRVRRSADGRRERPADEQRPPAGATVPVESATTVSAVLAHPPRPRKKKRRA